jgi:hypothetical protein
MNLSDVVMSTFNFNFLIQQALSNIKFASTQGFPISLQFHFCSKHAHLQFTTFSLPALLFWTHTSSTWNTYLSIFTLRCNFPRKISPLLQNRNELLTGWLYHAVTYTWIPWLIIMGSGLDGWNYWHFFTITANYNSSQSVTHSIPYWTTSVSYSTATNDDRWITAHTLNSSCLTNAFFI